MNNAALLIVIILAPSLPHNCHYSNRVSNCPDPLAYIHASGTPLLSIQISSTGFRTEQIRIIIAAAIYPMLNQHLMIILSSLDFKQLPRVGCTFVLDSSLHCVQNSKVNEALTVAAIASGIITASIMATNFFIGLYLAPACNIMCGCPCRQLSSSMKDRKPARPLKGNCTPPLSPSSSPSFLFLYSSKPSI